MNNPKVLQGKELILAALEEERQKITSINPPDPSKQESYANALKEFAELRGSPLKYNYLGSGRGNGVFVELLDGSVKYDFITGIGVYALGHCHKELTSTLIDSALSNTSMQGNLQQNADSLELFRLLREVSKFPHCILTNSGAMALENALKIAFQKRTPANRVLAFERCFAGRTLALSQINDRPSYREGLPPNIAVDYIPFFDPQKPKESIEKATKTLKEHLTRYPKMHAAMIFELVQGEGGCYCGDKEFFKALMEILKENQVLIIADEIQTFGRLPQLFAFQHFGLQNYIDICTIGKLSLVCATLFSSEVNPKPTLMGQTFTSSTSAIQGALFILKTLLEGRFYGPEGKIQTLFNHFEEKLKEIERRNPDLIRGPYGIGGMIAFTPYDGDYDRVVKLSTALFEAGVICHVAGINPTRIRMLPPFGVITKNDINEVCKIIEKTLKIG